MLRLGANVGYATTPIPYQVLLAPRALRISLSYSACIMPETKTLTLSSIKLSHCI